MWINKSGKWFQFRVPQQWDNLTAEAIFKENWKVPKKLLHQWRMEKLVKIDDQTINWSKPLSLGTEISIALFTEEDYGVIPQQLAIDVLFEDDHLIVVNKPAGMDTHPNSEGQLNTLANGVAFYLQQKGEKRRVRHIHRLDKDTSGAVLFAKHALSHAILDRLLNERRIKRTYYALVHGIIQPSSLKINEPIGRDRHHATRRRVSKSGQSAQTRVLVIQKFMKEKMSLIQCSLDTGRTHQIRVHLSHIGHPLVGDLLYGGKPLFPRQALHARELTFLHPFTEEKVKCIAPFNDQPAIFETYVNRVNK